jgi:hypothetical protein
VEVLGRSLVSGGGYTCLGMMGRCTVNFYAPILGLTLCKSRPRSDQI